MSIDEGKAVLVHIFRGIDRIFAVTEDSSGSNLPTQFGPWAEFKSLELIRSRAQAGINVDECLDDLETYGVHVTNAHVRITEQALS